jgi:hypothetical protein
MSSLVINQATDSRTGRPTRAPGRGYNTGHADQDLDDDEVDFEDESGDDIDDEDEEIGQGDRPARPRSRAGDRSTVGNRRRRLLRLIANADPRDEAAWQRLYRLVGDRPALNCACGGDQDMAPPAMDYGPRYRGPRIVTNRNPMAPPSLDFSDSPCANLANPRRPADVRRDDFGTDGDKGRHLGMADSDDDEDKAEGSNASARGSGSWAEALQYGKEGGMDDWEEDPVPMNYRRLGVLNAAGDDSDMAPPVMDYGPSPLDRRERR